MPDQDPAPSGESLEPSPEQREEVRRALEEAPLVANLPPFYEEERRERAQVLVLKGGYAWTLLGLLGGQIAVVDFVLVVYAWKGVSWRVEPWIIDAWLGATVIEVIGIVLVITRHLFPKRDEGPDAGQ